MRILLCLGLLFNSSFSSISSYNSINDMFNKYSGYLKQDLKTQFDDVKNIVETHKFGLAVLLGSGVYLFTFYKLSILKKLINDKNNWSFWNANVNFETLSTLPKSQITKEIMSDIEKKYYNLENIKFYIDPFLMFDLNIEQEINDLTEFINLVEMIQKLNLQKIYSLNADDILDAQKKIQRLSYLRNLFLFCNFNQYRFE